MGYKINKSFLTEKFHILSNLWCKCGSVLKTASTRTWLLKFSQKLKCVLKIESLVKKSDLGQFWTKIVTKISHIFWLKKIICLVIFLTNRPNSPREKLLKNPRIQFFPREHPSLGNVCHVKNHKKTNLRLNIEDLDEDRCTVAAVR